MSKYDQLAFSSKPQLYLASPTTTDQSGTALYTLSSNTLSASGQPIIYGHETSFKVTDTEGVTVDGNAFFQNGITTEFVMYAEKPIQETGILVADNGNSVFMSDQGIGLRLNFENEGNPSAFVAFVKISDWHKKLHILINIGTNQALLTVNGDSDIILLTGELDESATETVVGANFSTEYYFLLDGLGTYTTKIANKHDAINDPGSGHAAYAQAILNGATTNFTSYDSAQKVKLTMADFVYDWTNETWIAGYQLPPVSSEDFYLVIKTNNDSLTVKYDVNGVEVLEFTKILVLSFISNQNVVSFSIPKDRPDNFEITIETIVSASIFSQTPAFLIASGAPVFPESFETSIVNCPEGVRMDGASFDGTWLADNAAGDKPRSIEIVFKPREDGVIFSSPDGSISLSAQTGYSLWLNGVSVVDLTDVRIGQWNHLVITKSGSTAGTFTLNTDQADVDYMVLAAYLTVLTTGQIQELYNVVIGADTLSVSEAPVTVAEGAFDDGQAVSIYSPVWSIVGSGGN